MKLVDYLRILFDSRVFFLSEYSIPNLENTHNTLMYKYENNHQPNPNTQNYLKAALALCFNRHNFVNNLYE